jgi:hypothetical protein
MEGKPGKEKSEGFWREMRAGVPHVSHPLRDMGFHSSIPVRALGGLVFRLPHFNRGWPILAFFARVGIHNPYSEGFTGPGGRILLTRFLPEPEVGNPSTVMQVLKQRTAHALLPKRRRRNLRQRNLFGDELPPRVFWQALLRLQCMDGQEARGEALVYASKSGEARARGNARAMALEQLLFLSSRRGPGKGE